MPTDLPSFGTLGLQIVAAVVSLVILPTIPMIYKLVKTYFEAKISAIEQKGLREMAEFAFKRLDHLVTNVVDEIAQTAAKNTGLTEEEKKYRKNLAVTRVKAQLTPSNENVLQQEVKDLDRYILTKVEATRFFQKTLDQKEI